MKALKIIGYVLVGFLAIVFAITLAQPSHGHVDRSVVINAPASAIFPYLNDFKKANMWSPWTKMDPEAKQTFDGAEAGVNARMSWNGEKTGKGSQLITESVENERIKIALTFDGEEGTAWADFILSPEGNGTKVTWTYDGENNGLSGKARWIIGGFFTRTAYESGLKDLKQLVESAPTVEPIQELTPADSTATK
jgi:uncharacterized protein YndB with AHSA1/START domain